MSDMEDRNIDRIFQQSQDMHDFDFNPDAWRQMEELLDEDKKDRKFIWWIWGAGLLLLGLVLYCCLDCCSPKVIGEKDADPAQKELSSSTTEESQEEVLNLEEKTNDESEQSRKESVNIETAEAIDAESFVEEQSRDRIQEIETASKERVITKQSSKTKVAKRQSQGSSSRFTDNIASKDLAEGTLPINASLSNRQRDAKAQQREKAGNDADAPDMNTKESNTSLLDLAKVPSENQSDISKREAPISNENEGAQDLTAKDKSQNDLTSDALEAEVTSIAANRDLYTVAPIDGIILLLQNRTKPSLVDTLPSKEIVSVDDSDIGFMLGMLLGVERTQEISTKIGNADLKMGLSATMLAKKKFSFGLGFNYINKKYEAGKGAYIAPVGFWVNGISPERTIAECKIFEVPLSLAFYFGGYRNNSFLVESSVSSFFMFREWYVFQYQNPDPALVQNWRGENKSRHWLASADVALGYQYVLNPRYSLKAMTYMQFPLDGIGHGQVKLQNAGFRLHLNYSFK